MKERQQELRKTYQWTKITFHIRRFESGIRALSIFTWSTMGNSSWKFLSLTHLRPHQQFESFDVRIVLCHSTNCEMVTWSFRQLNIAMECVRLVSSSLSSTRANYAKTGQETQDSRAENWPQAAKTQV